MPANHFFADRSFGQRLWVAAKPRAWPKILLPWLLGIALAFEAFGGLNFAASIATLGYAFFGALFILFVNDWADQEVDRLRRRILPESSPKTIADGVLPAQIVLQLGIGALVVASFCALWAGWVRQEVPVAVLGVFGLFLFSAYSLPPFRLNDRGGGEFLEALGVAIVLPVFSFAAQVPLSSTISALKEPLRCGFLLGFLLLALAGAIASGLSDEHSDRLGGKRTWAVLAGNRIARRSIEALVLSASVIWLLTSFVWEWRLLFSGLVALVTFALLIRQSPRAAQHDAPGLASYKNALRSGLGRSIVVYCLTLVLTPVVES